MWMNMCSERKVCRNTSEGRPRWKEWEKERDDKAWDRERVVIWERWQRRMKTERGVLAG